MIYTFIGILLGIGFICNLPKLMEWTDWPSNEWKRKLINLTKNYEHKEQNN